jgi:Pro-kumamolisin, activation domain/IPT/TIG domain
VNKTPVQATSSSSARKLGGGLFALLLVAAVVGAGASTAFSFSPSGASSARAKVALHGEVPSIPSDVTRLGSVPSAQSVHVDVGLAGQNPTGLAAAVSAISTPGSPDYHQYLTSAQFAAAYGPTTTEVDQVSSALRAQGLTVGTPTVGSNLLPVSGQAHTISAVFDTPLESVRLPGNVRSMVNTAAPKVPASVAADITGVIGLSGLSEQHSMLESSSEARADAVRASGSSGSTAAGSSGAGSSGAGSSGAGSSGADPHLTAAVADPQACPVASTAAAQGKGYTSTQLATDYGLNQLFTQGRTGIGQTIGVVEFEPFSSSDISTFEACYGLSNPVQTVVVDGAPNNATGPGEAELDIEMAAVNAPSASIIVYEAPNETNESTALDLFNRIATDDQAQVVTTSWGECEAQDIPAGAAAEENTIFERMAAQGQTMVAASGDEGSEDCYSPFTTPVQTQLAVDDPGSQPDVLAVGGTTMVNGDVAGQSAWNNCEGDVLGVCQQYGGNGAGGGGYSAVWPKPTWQTAAGDARAVPDISSSADPSHGVAFYYAADGGWSDVGGTSMVSPEIAGFLADTNQGCTKTVGMVNPALYADDNSADFTNVTTGDNDFTGTNDGSYQAGAGYSPATGLGTPVEQNLAIALQGVGGCPSVSGLSAYSGPVSGAGDITISGGGLADASSISFGAAGAGTIVSRAATSLVVQPPSPDKAVCVNVTVTNPLGTSMTSSAGSYAFGGSGTCNGYRFVASDGGVFDFGSAPFEGSTGGIALQAPIVGMAATPDGNGYWVVAADGGIFTFGDAGFYGSLGATHLNAPIVGMASTPDGKGYWLVAADGGIFTFGDASFFGSTGAMTLNKPIVGMAATPDGQGYWLVAADGGIFTFGNADYLGSTGAVTLNKPIVGMASSADGKGYWLVAADGGIFTYGDAPYLGSTGGMTLNKPIVGMAATPDGKGYWLVASDGGVFTFGDAPFFGSTGGINLNEPIVAMASG